MLHLLNDSDSHVSDDNSYFSCSTSDDSFVSIPSLSDTLECQFSDVPKNFNVVHINAQSVPAHFPDMLASFTQKNVHAILVSESWLKPCLPSTSFSLPGFRLIRNDRTGRVGGGVAIYLRSYISFSIISMSPQPPPTNAGEHLFIEITLPHSKTLLGVYYSPSSHTDFFLTFERLLEECVPSYDHTIIMGDFNTCLLKNDRRSKTLANIVNSCNLHILPLNSTHHFPNSNPSLLDIVVVGSQEHVVKHGQLAADAFSYHDLLYLSYKLRPPKNSPKVIMRRSFGGINQEAFRRDAEQTDWSAIREAESVNDKVLIFNSLITQLYDVHAPLKAIKLKHLPAPWLTDEIRCLMRRKHAAKANYKRHPSDATKAKYQNLRNRCNRVCRDAYRRHIHKSVAEEDPAKVWKFLKSLGIGKSRQNCIPNFTDIDSLNHHFSSSSHIDLSIKRQTIQYLQSLPIPSHAPFVFNRFTDCDVKKCIISVTSNSTGVDGICRNMLVPILDLLLPSICHILNFSIENGAYPSIWKDAQIIPLPKKPNPQSLAEFRPISILPFLSKVLERLVHSQISSYLSKHNLLSPFQSGFRSGHSTVTALINITDDIRLGMENGLLTVLSLLDFSSAFNSVDFDVLLAVLRTFNISPTVIDWFHNYLYGRRQRVCFEDTFSSWCDTRAGVPQGGVLSPLLFAIFINSISHNISSTYHLYADDLQIYCQAPLDRLSSAIATINSDLDGISDWSHRFGLIVNPGKTQVAIVGSSRLICKVDWRELPSVVFEGIKIPYSEYVVNLGITIDRCLSWGPQLTAVSSKLFASAASLRRLRNFLPTATKIALAESLLLPLLDYADICYLDLTQDQLNKLERLQNFCIRFIFGLRKYDHVSDFRTRLKWLPIRLRRNTHILNLLYNILFHPNVPRYLKERFIFLHTSHSHSLRSSENLTLKTPPHSTVFFENSFTVQAVRLWNALPVSIRQAPSLYTFKRQVKDFYLSKL